MDYFRIIFTLSILIHSQAFRLASSTQPSTSLFMTSLGDLSSSSPSPSPPTKVVVIGAGRSVGLEVVKKLMRRKQSVEVTAIVRNERGKRALKSFGLPEERIRVADITDKNALKAAFVNLDGANVLLCASSSPRIKLFSRLKLALSRRILRRTNAKPRAEDLFYKEEESPYKVDYIGHRNCVDVAVSIKCRHFVLLSCMGGYRQPEMNEIGRSSDEEDEQVGNVLKWRRASERYLMKRLLFTIIHCGVLTEDFGVNTSANSSDKTTSSSSSSSSSGTTNYKRGTKIVWDTDDKLLLSGLKKSHPEDVAEVLIQSLLWKEAIGRSIDIASKPLKTSSSSSSSSSSSLAGDSKADWLRFWFASHALNNITYKGIQY